MKLTLLSLLPVTLAAPAPTLNKRAGPTVVASLPKATIVGRPGLLGVDTFNDIPFAQPPVGDLRLKPPQPLTADQGKVDATTLIPKGCPQMYFSTDPSAAPGNALGTVLNLPLFQTVQNTGEDCLTLNVQRPASAKAGDKLPVLFWIFGGGFELGSTQLYNGESLVVDSILDKQPIIFVAVNYRVGGFGFMPGKEIMQDGSGNLGLLDQRLGLQWVADNIAAFGGDPDKVTIWGESAGAISVMDQMLLYDGDNTYKGKLLFRAGIMNSGSIVPAQPLDSKKGQAIYDTVVKAAGCSGDSNTLACLRKVSYSKFLQAANSVPGILGYFTVNLSYLPRPDGKALTDSPDALVAAGKYTKVPFIVGDQEDEGTLFGLFTPNITTTDQITDYLSTYFFDKADPKAIADLVGTYQSTVEDSSPFRTTTLQNWYPQFMRMSAIIGDATFTLSRRIFLQGHSAINPGIPSWSYLSSYDYGTPILGTLHGSDILQVFLGILPNNAKNTIRGYYYNFIYNLDPNVGVKLDNWPKWKDGQQLMNFAANSNKLIGDDFRQDSAEWLKNNVASLRV